MCATSYNNKGAANILHLVSQTATQITNELQWKFSKYWEIPNKAVKQCTETKFYNTITITTNTTSKLWENCTIKWKKHL